MSSSWYIPQPAEAKSYAGRLRLLYYRWGMMHLAHALGFKPSAAVARWVGRFLWENITAIRQGVGFEVGKALANSRTPEEIEPIARSSAEQFALPLLESEFVHRMLTPGTWRRHIRFEGGEQVVAALRDGRGVVAAGPALGSYVVALAALGYFLDGKVAAIVSPRQFSSDQRAMAGLVRRRLVRLYPGGEAITGAIEALRSGKLLLMISERERASERTTVQVDFLGRSAQFHPTPAILAWRTRSPIAVVACHRLPEPFCFEARVYDWIEPPASGRKEWVVAATQRIASTLDSVIRAHPADYRWATPFMLLGQ